ncbi:MAG: redoxin domain-containing protein [Planctomycetota bacterium]
MPTDGRIVGSPIGRSPLPRTAWKALFQRRGEKGTVLVFTSTECPIANAYIPILKDLEDHYREQGVRFVFINPNHRVEPNAIRKHAEEYRLGSPVLIDAEGMIARELRVTKCPAVCVFDGDGKLVYRGRIDDRYYQRGKSPKAVIARILERKRSRRCSRVNQFSSRKRNRSVAPLLRRRLVRIHHATLWRKSLFAATSLLCSRNIARNATDRTEWVLLPS